MNLYNKTDLDGVWLWGAGLCMYSHKTTPTMHPDQDIQWCIWCNDAPWINSLGHES